MSRQMKIIGALLATSLFCGSQVVAECQPGFPGCAQSMNRTFENPAVDIHILSRAFGHLLGRELLEQGIELDLDEVMEGIRAELMDQPSPMTDEQYATTLQKFRQGELQEIAGHNLALAEAFMASNAKRPGIIEIVPLKLQYKVIQSGRGSSVSESVAPLVRYTGHYLDGTLFGSTDATGTPIAIPLEKMISGFSKGVVGMKEGEKRRIFIHPDLAYGLISEIPPNSLLIFDVEVVQSDATRRKQETMRAPLTADNREESFSHKPLRMRRADD